MPDTGTNDLSSLTAPQYVSIIVDLRQQIALLEARLQVLSGPAAYSLSSSGPPSSVPSRPSSAASLLNGPAPNNPNLQEPAPFVPLAMDSSELSPHPQFTTVKRRSKRARTTSPPTLSDDSSSSSSDESEAGKERSPPPILLRQKLLWPKIQSVLSKHDISVRRAINTTDGVKIYLQSVEDFRSFSKRLDDSKIEYSTNQLRQDRELVVIIRGVNEAITEDAIKQELLNKAFPVRRVHRMRNGEKIWPLVAVHLDPSSDSAKTIFELNTLGGLCIKVEPKRKSNTIPQCRRCQRFFHTANYCHAAWVCAFCSRNHATPACKSKDAKENSPTCANCKGPHRSTYRGCTKAPKKRPLAKKGKKPDTPQSHKQPGPPWPWLPSNPNPLTLTMAPPPAPTPALSKPPPLT